MEFTDLEKALLSGAPLNTDQNPSVRELAENYGNISLKSMSYFQNCIGNDLEWAEQSSQPSQYTKWQWIQKPVGVNENEQCLLLGASLVKAYVLVNYTEPKENFDPDFASVLDGVMKTTYVNDSLDVDGEGIRPNISFPALIMIASKLLDVVDVEMCPSVSWWKARTVFLHQKLLEEKSPKLYTIIKDNLKNEIFLKAVESQKDLNLLFLCEMIDIYLYFYEVTVAKSILANIEELNGLVVDTCGVLGKRTKYQQTALPQLVLKMSRSGPPIESFDFNRLPLNSHPKTCPLNDDTRLDKIAIENASDIEFDQSSLSPLDYVYIFAKFIFVKVSQPDDGLCEEELTAFLSVLADEPLSWALKVSSLYYRSMLESNHRRTVERSLEQLQVLQDELIRSTLSHEIRYQFFFASRLPTSSEIEISMADVMMSLGSTKTALDTYVKYNVYEKAIHCYHKLDLRHKAEELIRHELEKSESVKLWILLGDATDDTKYYEKAWDFSNGRSGRAQRQWGYYHYHKKQYEEATIHFSKSLELNSLEYETWLSYGYTLMETKKWEDCVKAYLYCVNLNYDNFQAWNNLAVAHRNLKNYEKALNALLTAAKCDYEVWKVWENILTLGIECNAIDEVLLAYNRLLDLKSNKYIDATALCYITHAIINDQLDNKGQKCTLQKKKALTLLGRVTAAETGNGTVWSVYSDLLLSTTEGENQINEETYFRSMQYAEKSIRAYMQKSIWPQIGNEAQKVVDSVKVFISKVEDFLKLFPNSSSRPEWISKLNYFINHVKSSLNQSTGRMVEIPKEFTDMLQAMEGEQERVKLLN